MREPSTHFVSAAEMVKKFQSSTRDLSLPSASSSLTHVSTSFMLHFFFFLSRCSDLLSIFNFIVF